MSQITIIFRSFSLKSHGNLKMDMLSLVRKRCATRPPESSKRRSPRIAQGQPSGAKTAVNNRQLLSNDEKYLSTIDTSQPAISESQNGNIVLRILAKPGANQSGITDIADDCIGVRVGAPAREAQANIELVRYLASVLQLRRTNVTVDKGARSRIKSVLVNKNGLTVDRVRDLIDQEFSKDVE